MKKLLLILLILSACSAEDHGPIDQETVNYKVYYFKDGRTGLCFAAIDNFSATYYGYSVRSTSLANVPCEKCNHLIK